MTDRLTVRTIALGLIVLALGTVIGLVYCLGAVDLSPEQRGQVLGILGTMGAGALGAVAGLLAHTSSVDPNPTVAEVADQLAQLEPADPDLEAAVPVARAEPLADPVGPVDDDGELEAAVPVAREEPPTDPALEPDSPPDPGATTEA